MHNYVEDRAAEAVNLFIDFGPLDAKGLGVELARDDG